MAFAEELCVMVALVTLNELNALLAPIAPVKVAVPAPPVTVRACVPFSVPPNVTAPPAPLVLIALVPVSVAGTALVITNELAVMLLPMLTLLVPAVDEIKMGPSRVVPTTPPNVIAPLDPELSVKP